MAERGVDVELPSYAKSLFGGVIADDLVFPYPAFERHAEETVETYLDDLRRFLDAKVSGEEFDRRASIPEGVLDGLAERGVFGLTVPTRYDGLGFSQRQANRVLAEIGARDPGLAVVVGAHLSIGLKGIVLYGTEEQKRRWLPPCARGETLAAFALTEPGHGSDAAHVESRAVPDPGGGWRLGGTKIWIGNAHRAGVITVFAQTPVTRGGETVDRVTAFVVEGDDPGLEIGRLWTDIKLGIRSSTQAEIHFRDIELPDDRVLDRPGHGFKVAVNILNGGRLGLAAFALGGTRAILDEAIDFATTRHQFGRPIAEFDLIREKIARTRLDLWVAEAMVETTAHLMDRGDVDYSLESAICKVFASEAAWRASDDALQIAGGRGYMGDRPFERFLRDARILPIFEGTNEVLRLFIALAGMEKLGEYLEGIGRALREPLKEFGVLTEFAFHRVRDVVGTSRAAVDVAEPLAGCLRHFENLVGRLHADAEGAIRTHGAALAGEQLVLARLADMAIDLYAVTVTLSRAQAAIEEKGADAAEREIDLARHVCRQASGRIDAASAAIGDNRDRRVRRIAAAAIAERQGARG